MRCVLTLLYTRDLSNPVIPSTEFSLRFMIPKAEFGIELADIDLLAREVIMPGIQAGGAGSGLDINSLVSKLVTVEGQAKSHRLDYGEALASAKMSAIGTLKSAVQDFKSSLSSVNNLSALATRVAKSSDITLLTASANNKAASGNYSIVVKQLADSQKLKSIGFSTVNTEIGTGTLSIAFGTYDSESNQFNLNPKTATTTITIDNKNNTLEGIRDAINASSADVDASIIFDGSEYHLVVTSNNTGTSNSIKITVDDSDSEDKNNHGLSRLSYDPTQLIGSGKNMEESIAPLDALLRIDGIDIQSSSNTISDAIDNVSLTLKDADIDKKINLTISSDKSATSKKINSVITKFNDLIKTIKTTGGYDEANKKAGILMGDFSLMSIENNVRNSLLSSIQNLNGNFQTLSDIGITSNEDGTLSVNDSKLDEALEKDFDGVSKLFAPSAAGPDSFVSMVSSTSSTLAGDYSLRISTLATQGRIVGNAPANLDIVDGINNTLVFSIDGTTATVKLNPGTYTPDSLAAEIQSRVNGASEFSKKSISIHVKQNSGILDFYSTRYGSASTIDIVGGNGKSDLLGTTPIVTAGVDIEGFIGGVAATGSGQTLSLVQGNAKGLKIAVTGGPTGDRGFIHFSKGIVEDTDALLEDYVGDKRIFSESNSRWQKKIEEIGHEREVLSDRLAQYEKRLLRQFTSLDSLVSRMQSTSSFLSTQLANMPVLNKKR